jgi:hypothetical protein
MTEPQELRSIDELFKNTFNNLPDTPAESGWDTPSEMVWQHVRERVKPPRTGWSLSSMLLLAGFAVILAVGLYFAYSNPAKVQEKQVVPETSTIASPVDPVISQPETSATLPAPNIVEAPKQQQLLPRATKVTPTSPTLEQDAAAPMTRVQPRSNGAAPLPGTTITEMPNTTEAIKAEHARQLALRWKTPLQLLPVPRKAN